jgi:hypothetical protein
MKFDLVAPYKDCPFRMDVKPYLNQERAKEICDALERGLTFSCHKTNDFDDEGDAMETAESQHCAGALIMLEKMEMPNQMMCIAERLRMYDASKLRMDSPVYDDSDVMIDSYREQA